MARTLVIFDLDDTLIQSGEIDSDCFREAFAVAFGLRDLAGCGKTSFAGANPGFGGHFRLTAERNCALGRLPVLRRSLVGVPLLTEHQVEHSNGLIRTRL